MKKYRKNLILALVCFLIVIVLNFFLPRLLPGNPIAYLTGFSEEDMTPAQVAYYRQALHLDEPVFAQFGHYLRSLLTEHLATPTRKKPQFLPSLGSGWDTPCRSPCPPCCSARRWDFCGDCTAATKRAAS